MAGNLIAKQKNFGELAFEKPLTADQAQRIMNDHSSPVGRVIRKTVEIQHGFYEAVAKLVNLCRDDIAFGERHKMWAYDERQASSCALQLLSYLKDQERGYEEAERGQMTTWLQLDHVRRDRRIIADARVGLEMLCGSGLLSRRSWFLSVDPAIGRGNPLAPHLAQAYEQLWKDIRIPPHDETERFVAAFAPHITGETPSIEATRVALRRSRAGARGREAKA